MSRATLSLPYGTFFEESWVPRRSRACSMQHQDLRRSHRLFSIRVGWDLWYEEKRREEKECLQTRGEMLLASDRNS